MIFPGTLGTVPDAPIPARAAFYCVSGSDYFLGAVAMINSLRLHGHHDPVHVLDCGLEPWQRAALAPEVVLHTAPADVPPSLLKWTVPRTDPAEVMFLLDTDMIATRSLVGLIDRAAEGTLVAFENDRHRHFDEWGDLLGVGEPREGPYLSSGAVCVSRALDPELPDVLDRLCGRLERARTWIEDGDQLDPLFFADQDILNAVVLARLPAERVLALAPRLSATPPFATLRCLDRGRLRCAYRDGTEPYLLHHFARKPWLVRTRANVYSRLMTRLLCGSDVSIRLETKRIPPRLRTGPQAAMRRLWVDLAIGVPEGVRRRIGPERRIRAWPNTAGGSRGGSSSPGRGLDETPGGEGTTPQ